MTSCEKYTKHVHPRAASKVAATFKLRIRHRAPQQAQADLFSPQTRMNKLNKKKRTGRR
jgi:hypothetical protein